jgi:hypothetical protein
MEWLVYNYDIDTTEGELKSVPQAFQLLSKVYISHSPTYNLPLHAFNQTEAFVRITRQRPIGCWLFAHFIVDSHFLRACTTWLMSPRRNSVNCDRTCAHTHTYRKHSLFDKKTWNFLKYSYSLSCRPTSQIMNFIHAKRRTCEKKVKMPFFQCFCWNLRFCGILFWWFIDWFLPTKFCMKSVRDDRHIQLSSAPTQFWFCMFNQIERYEILSAAHQFSNYFPKYLQSE